MGFHELDAEQPSARKVVRFGALHFDVYGVLPAAQAFGQIDIEADRPPGADPRSVAFLLFIADNAQSIRRQRIVLALEHLRFGLNIQLFNPRVQIIRNADFHVRGSADQVDERIAARRI